jgi:hypothetical protein
VRSALTRSEGALQLALVRRDPFVQGNQNLLRGVPRPPAGECGPDAEQVLALAHVPVYEPHTGLAQAGQVEL